MHPFALWRRAFGGVGRRSVALGDSPAWVPWEYRGIHSRPPSDIAAKLWRRWREFTPPGPRPPSSCAPHAAPAAAHVCAAGWESPSVPNQQSRPLHVQQWARLRCPCSPRAPRPNKRAPSERPLGGSTGARLVAPLAGAPTKRPVGSAGRGTARTWLLGRATSRSQPGKGGPSRRNLPSWQNLP